MPGEGTVMKTRNAKALVTADDLALRRAWAEQFLSDAAHLPISFVLDGKQIYGLPAAWQPTAMTRRLDANLSETVLAGRDPQSGLEVRVECTFYQNYPVVEWVAWLNNPTAQATPLISDIL